MSSESRAAFEAWWESDGQFCRAGGGAYEKTFAFNAWQASRKAALEEAAALCFNNCEELSKKNGRSLAPFPHECGGLHAGMTYAKAIRSLK